MDIFQDDFLANESTMPVDDENISLKKRYEISSEMWEKKKLVYFIENESTSMSKTEAHNRIRWAFELWAEYIPVNIYESVDRSMADILIRFADGDHGDDYPFDGRAGVLAHAFYPPNGEVHFDDDEKFVIGTPKKGEASFYYTSSHEFGHSLGLKHSLTSKSLMSPYHPGPGTQIKLHDDDILGIQSIYGKGKGKVYVSSTKAARDYMSKLKHLKHLEEKSKLKNIKCINNVNAVIKSPSSKILYFFSGDVYYEVERNPKGGLRITAGSPRNVTLGWGNIRGKADAAFTNTSQDAAYFFRGDVYWKFNFAENEMFPGYPKKLAKKIPRNLTGVVSSGEKSYFFSTNGLYEIKINETKPRRISNKAENIDAAFPLFIDGYYATVKGNKYSIYRIKNRKPVATFSNRSLRADFGLPFCQDNPSDNDIKLEQLRYLCVAYYTIRKHSKNVQVVPEGCDLFTNDSGFGDLLPEEGIRFIT